LTTYSYTEKGLNELNKDIEEMSISNCELIKERDALQVHTSELDGKINETIGLSNFVKEKLSLLAEKKELSPKKRECLQDLLKVIQEAKNEIGRVKSNLEKEIDNTLMEGFASTAGWDNINWKHWAPDLSEMKLPVFLRLGEDQNGIPIGIPFMGQKKHRGAILILASEEKTELAKNILSCLVLRVALSLPKVSKFCLIDPEHHGRSFRMQKDLPDVRTLDGSLEQDLQLISNDVKRVSTTVLGYEDSFEDVTPEIWATERFESVFVADFGSNKTTNSRVFEALLDIANGGWAAGRYLFMHVNTDCELPKNIDLSKFKNAEIINLNNDNFKHDLLPEGREQSRLLGIIRDQKAPKKTINFETLVGVNASNGWRESSKNWIETPVGSNLSVWFGQKDGKSCAHGALAGSTGSGKSNFLHVLISGLALRYSPNELKMYLVDGKSGVGFKRYEQLPHANVVSLHTSPLLALSVIRDLLCEMESRYQLFSEHAVDSIVSYRDSFPEQVMPRLLLVADEYQNLFESDSAEATSIISKLAEKGRAAGIHLLLSSQRFVAQGMGKPDHIFNNIAMRISLPVADAVGLVDFFGNKGRKMIQELNQPGMVVINDNLGEDSASQRGVTVMLSDEESKRVNSGLSERAASANDLKADCIPTVFHGDDSPKFMDSKTIHSMLSRSHWHSEDDLEKLAKQPARNGGFSIQKWHSSQKPLALMSGRLFEVYGDFIFSLQRSGNEHLLVVGDNASHGVGLLSSSFASIAAIHSPDKVEFQMIDLIHPEMPGGGILRGLNNELLSPLCYSVSIESDEIRAAAMIKSLAEMIDARKGGSLAEQVSIVVVVSGLEDIESLSSTEGRSRLGVKSDLKKILRQGSQVGLHLLVQLTSVEQFSSVFDEREMKYFNHRIAWQISEPDSRKLMGVPDASRLNELADGEIAMYKNIQQGKSGICYFRPYLIGSEGIIDLSKKLSGRVE